MSQPSPLQHGAVKLGLLGSQAYIESNQEYIDSLDLYVNLDSTNLNPSKGLGTLGIETSDSKLVDSISKIQSSVLNNDEWNDYDATVQVNQQGNSDHRAFNQFGTSTIGFYGWEYEEYHRQTDVPNVVHKEGLALTVEIVLQILVAHGRS